MKTCKKCNKEFPDSAKFCRTCGGELVGKQQLSSDFQAKDSVFKIKLSETPDDSGLLIDYSEFLLANNAYEAAITKMNEFLETSPKNLDVRKLLAKAHKASNDMEAFIAQLLIIEEFSENIDLELKYDLAKAYYDTGSLKQATDQIDGILKHEPDDIETIKLKADVLKKGSDIPAYESLLRKLIQIDPNNNAASVLFYHFYDKEEMTEAYKLAEGGYQAISDDPLAFFISAKERIINHVAESDSDLQTAEVFLDKALKHDPALPIKELNEARIYKLYLDAVEKKGRQPFLEWESLQEYFPDFLLKSIYSTIYDESCRYYTKEQNAISAISACKKSIDLEPTDTRYSQLALLYQMQAEYLEAKGDRTGALRYLKDAYNLLEQHPSIEHEGMVNIENEVARIKGGYKSKRNRRIIYAVTVLVIIIFFLYLTRGLVLSEIQFVSEPEGATISIEGAFLKRSCTAPCSIRDLIPGEKTIKATLENYNLYSADFDIPIGSKQENHQIIFKSNLEIVTIPEGAEVDLPSKEWTLSSWIS